MNIHNIMLATEVDFFQFFERFGIPMGILTVFAYFVAQSIRWFGTNVVVPMKDRHVCFLDNLEKCLDRMSDSQLRISENTSSIRSDVDKLCENSKDIRNENKAIKEKMDGLNSMVFQTMISNGKYDSKVTAQYQPEIKKEG